MEIRKGHKIRKDIKINKPDILALVHKKKKIALKEAIDNRQ